MRVLGLLKERFLAINGGVVMAIWATAVFIKWLVG